MAYYVISGKNKKDYKIIDITKSPIFYKQSKFATRGACNQKEIDDFTMQFNDQEELKSHLFSYGLIEESDFSKPLTTRIKENDTYRKVIYDFLYQDSLELMYNPKEVIKYLNEKLYENDFQFIEKFANFFNNYHECSSSCPELLSAVENSIFNNQRSNHLNERDQNQDNLITRVAKLLIYKHYQQPNGKINYSEEVQYKNLHTIVAFIKNYEKTKQQEEITRCLEVKPKEKILKKEKKECIDGQTSLF